jgi:D-arginine utilization repressor
MFSLWSKTMKKTEFQTAWEMYEPFVKAIVELFHPFVEAAVHDLETGKLAALYHNLSKRKVGEASPLKELGVETKDFPDYFAPYYKQNWDGGPLKCTSITFRNKKGEPVGLICFNVDTSFFQDGVRLIEAFLKTKKAADNPVEIFGSNCESLAMSIIQGYLDEKQLSLAHLSREQKRDIVQLLFQKGLFNFKNAAPFIARKLKLSRATVYNIIKR